jgi:hypothetical protein
MVILGHLEGSVFKQFQIFRGSFPQFQLSAVGFVSRNRASVSARKL